MNETLADLGICKYSIDKCVSWNIGYSKYWSFSLQVYMLDSLPIFAALNFHVGTCDCCQKQHIKRTVEINSSEIDTIYLGVTCAGQWFDVNLSGNPYKAIARLNRKLRDLSNEQIESIVENIREAQDEQ